jgi:DNA-directed RNA polymerase specialized sigma24 family protein
VAFGTLSERERFVLQMVEVRQMRYHELASVIGTRPEALKMVVFRARKRVYDRVSGMLSACRSERPREPHLAMA